MIKIVNKLICALLFPLLLSGCWDQKEIEKKAYVYAIGMDKAKEKGKFTLTYLIVNPEYGSLIQGGGTEGNPYESITFEVNDLISARSIANSVIAKEVSYDLLRVILVSEDFAKEKQFIRWIYDATKDREIRRDNYFIVTKEPVSTFFERNKPKLETRVHKYYELILQRGVETGFIPDSELHRFFRVVEADSDLFLAIYGTTEKDPDEEPPKDEEQIFAGELNSRGVTNNTQFLGSAVFKEGRMIGKLTGEETRISIILNDTLNMKDVLTTFPDPFSKEYRIAARLVKKRDNKVEMNLKKGSGVIDVTIPLQIEILSDHGMVNYAKNKKKREQLKRYLEEEFSKEVAKFVERTQKEFKGEPFGWSLVARKQFQTIPEYSKFNWMKSYPNMDVNIKVNVQFGEFGRQSELPSLKRVRD